MAGSRVPFGSSTSCSLSQQHHPIPVASQGNVSPRHLGTCVPGLSMCLWMCDHARGQVLSHGHGRAVLTSMETGTRVTFVLTWQCFPILLPLVHFFPFSGPALETTLSFHGICLAATMFCMPAGLYFIHQHPCLEQCLIFWLPFVVISSFVQCLCALMSISLSCAGKQQHDRNPPRIFVFPFHMNSGTKRFLRSTL